MKFKQLFDMLAEFAGKHEFRQVQESQKTPTFEKWLPIISILRTTRQEDVINFGGYYLQSNTENSLLL